MSQLGFQGISGNRLQNAILDPATNPAWLNSSAQWGSARKALRGCVDTNAFVQAHCELTIRRFVIPFLSTDW
jgi:hypothetical protein